MWGESGISTVMIGQGDKAYFYCCISLSVKVGSIVA